MSEGGRRRRDERAWQPQLPHCFRRRRLLLPLMHQITRTGATSGERERKGGSRRGSKSEGRREGKESERLHHKISHTHSLTSMQADKLGSMEAGRQACDGAVIAVKSSEEGEKRNKKDPQNRGRG